MGSKDVNYGSLIGDAAQLNIIERRYTKKAFFSIRIILLCVVLYFIIFYFASRSNFFERR